MTWPITLGLALLTGFIGMLSSGFVADRYLSWYHVPNNIGSGLLFIAMGANPGIAVPSRGLAALTPSWTGEVTKRTCGGAPFFLSSCLHEITAA